MTTLILAFAALAVSPDLASLSGRVISADGPVIGATVVIDSGEVRQGFSPIYPTRRPDCGKRAVTGEGGRFRIEGLDPSLVFRVLIVAEGFEPRIADGVEPGPKAVDFEAQRSEVAGLDPRFVVRGRVVGPDGGPVAGATVYPHGIAGPEGIIWGRVDEVDAMAVTDLRGEFALKAEKPDVALELAIGAPRLAARMFSGVKAGEPGRAFALEEGAYLRGRLVREGKPVAGVKVGLASANRNVGRLMVIESIGTDAEGRFQFNNIKADEDYQVYGISDSFKAMGALPSRPGRTGAIGSKVDMGELEVKPGLAISGRVALVTGGAVPAGTRVRCTSPPAWEPATTLTDEFGRFRFDGVTAGTVQIAVRAAGLRISELNQGLNLYQPFQLTGFLERDAEGVTILMEPGEALMFSLDLNSPEFKRKQKEVSGRLWPGVVVGVDPAMAR